MVDNQNIELAQSLGELKAQVRELIHDNNNRTQRDEAVALSLAMLQAIPKQLEAMGGRLEDRLRALEDDQVRREQTASIWRLIMKSPAVGWFLGIVMTAAAYLFGRSQ